MFWKHNYEDLKFLKLMKKIDIKRNTAPNNKELIKMDFSATVVSACIF